MAAAVRGVTLIGVCDGPIDANKHRPTFLTNKIGGRPDWLPDISRTSPQCRCCGQTVVLVVQVYCPLDSSPYHRNLHLFACPGPDCSGRPGSWTVLRSQGLEEEARTVGGPEPPQEAPLAVTAWCDGADDWGMEEDKWGGGKEDEVEEEPSGGGDGEFAIGLQLQRLHLEEAPAAGLRSLFISVLEEWELSGEDEELLHARQLLREYESREGATLDKLDQDGGAGGEERYEKTRARHGDAFFSSFRKKISPCPQQVLRYCRGGRPLLLSSNPAQTVSPCGTCGGARTFELQLMPALVSLLQAADGGGGGQVEFGTVLVYTCTNSCWGAGSTTPLEEECLVQQDPDQHLFR